MGRVAVLLRGHVLPGGHLLAVHQPATRHRVRAGGPGTAGGGRCVGVGFAGPGLDYRAAFPGLVPRRVWMTEPRVVVLGFPRRNRHSHAATPKGFDDIAQGCRTRLPWGAAAAPRVYPERVAYRPRANDHGTPCMLGEPSKMTTKPKTRQTVAPLASDRPEACVAAFFFRPEPEQLPGSRPHQQGRATPEALPHRGLPQ